MGKWDNTAGAIDGIDSKGHCEERRLGKYTGVMLYRTWEEMTRNLILKQWRKNS